MDIAGFVGFAARGPVDVPVVVEDMAQFEDVFGHDATLFWDPDSSERVTAHLGPAVRAFFRGGGSRCWVVRVTARRRRPGTQRRPGDAGFESLGSRARHPIPGVARLGADGRLEQAELCARAVGSWADGIRASAGLLSRRVDLVRESLTVGPGASSLTCLVRGRDAVRPGDLIRVTYRTSGVVLEFVVGAASSPDLASPPEREAETLLTVTGADAVWLATGRVGSPPGGAVTAEATIPGFGDLPAILEDDPSGTGGDVLVTVLLPLTSAPPPGTSIAMVVDGGAALLVVEDVRAGRAGPHGSSPPGGLEASPPSNGSSHATVIAGRLVRILSGPPTPTAPGASDPAEVLTFALRCRVEGDRVFELGELGFHPAHPRYGGALPGDEFLYRAFAEGGGVPSGPFSALWGEAMNPRFPLAGLPELLDDPHGPAPGPTLYPLEMESVEDEFVPPRIDSRRALDRDGLGAFDAGLFLDPDVAPSGTATTLETADFLRYGSTDPRPLVGAHALLGIDGVTIAAVPDVVHRAWHPTELPAKPDPPPFEPLIRTSDCADEWVVSAVEAGSPPGSDPSPSALRISRKGSDFEQCQVETLDAPVLSVETDRDPLGDIGLSWAAVPGALGYVVEETSDQRSWTGASEVYRGDRTTVQLFGRSPGAYFYRIRAVAGAVSSEWSNGVTAEVIVGEPWFRDSAGEDASADMGNATTRYSDSTIVAVHRALIRMCAARGDILAVLSVPLHYRESEVIGHAARVRGSTPSGPGGPEAVVLPLAGEERSLSFGALYHPWPVIARSDRPDQFRAEPPDGVAAGVLADRATTRGAWVAPANEVLADVVALQPPFAPPSYQRLQDGRANCLRHEPRGFLCLSADTLSDDPDLRLVNVRRLLSLLRRVCLRHGPTYVFEPNDEGFHRRIRRGFEAILADMLVRGAFAGATPDESYRVSTASPPNTPQSVDQGRLIVEIRVAPSIPMRFLTIRMVASGDRGVTVEGV